MAEPFISEIRMFSFNFAPKGWALCHGQFLPINQNQALFSLLGTTYGGNGQTTFALPNLRGRTPIHVGSGHTLGEAGGAEQHTLSIAQMPAHTHPLQANPGNATSNDPAGRVFARSAVSTYGTPGDLSAGTPLPPVGGSQPHTNMQPYLTINFCIALQGIFPRPN